MGQDLAGGGTAPGSDSKAGTASARRVHRDFMAVWSGQLPGSAPGSQADVWPDRTTATVREAATTVNALIHAAAELQAVCETHRWRFCFIGGLAVQRWGEPRETVDVDLTLLTGFADEARFVSVLMGTFESRIDNAGEFARVNRVLLLRAQSGVGLDIALGGLPFEELAVTRSSLFTFPPDVPLRTCSAEDLIVLKAFADRPKDWLDIEGIIIRQAARLDWPYVRAQLAPLAELKEAPELVDKLECRRVDLND